MSTQPVISLCIPTNGVVEWVCPVLDSIFRQNVDASLFEVIVTDNGSNEAFRETIVRDYLPRFSNLVYEKTTAPLFLNEIEAYKRAKGLLIKFINHRTMLVPGALEKLVTFARENAEEKPIAYFSNGVIENLQQECVVYSSFDLFVKNLSYWSSWSTGMTFWKSDFDKLPEDAVFNYLFPHTTILFQIRERGQYMIDNTIIMDEIPVHTKPKGKYDLFYAFAVEYPGILLDLLRAGDITADTFQSVKKDNLEFISRQYYYYVIRKKPCSYDLSSYNTSIRIFYSKTQANIEIAYTLWKEVVQKVKKILKKYVSVRSLSQSGENKRTNCR